MPLKALIVFSYVHLLVALIFPNDANPDEPQTPQKIAVARAKAAW